MRKDALALAIDEAERFIGRAQKALGQEDEINDQWWVHPGAAASAARRASLDLTRALAAVRTRRIDPITGAER